MKSLYYDADESGCFCPQKGLTVNSKSEQARLAHSVNQRLRSPTTMECDDFGVGESF
jgi:hypothetical protein